MGNLKIEITPKPNFTSFTVENVRGEIIFQAKEFSNYSIARALLAVLNINKQD